MLKNNIEKELSKITLVESLPEQEYFSTQINENGTTIRSSKKHTVIVETNNAKKSTRIAANLFTDNIFTYFSKFSINSDESLLEMWEFYLLGETLFDGEIYNVLRIVFYLGEIQFMKDNYTEIIVEESETKQYVTVTNIEGISKRIIESTIEKNNFLGSYKIENSTITFEVNLFLPNIQAVKQELNNAYVLENTEINSEEFSVRNIQVQTSQKLEVFNYMDQDDLLELEEYTNNLSSLMLIVGNNDISPEEVTDICHYLGKIGYTTATYNEIFPISKGVSDLSVGISSHVEEFINASNELGPMCKAFNNDLKQWIDMTFYSGAPSIDFMNDTITVNCQTICGMIKTDSQDDSCEALDDIFDF